MRGFAVIAEQGCRWGRGEAMSGRSTDGLCRTLSLGGAVCALAVGNAVVFPTDTVFGLGVSVSAAPGPQLLYDLKRRDAGKPVAWLVEGPEALPALDRKLHGFASDDAVMTAVEARSSSPVRIVRDDGFQSNIAGLYPCGEGAGYAGGITSAAVDGLRCAESVLAALQNEA